MKSEREGINALAEPSGTGCVECLATGQGKQGKMECGHGQFREPFGSNGTC
jgi:hypothetical protein